MSPMRSSVATERRLAPLPPPVNLAADEAPSRGPDPADTFRRSVLSRSSTRSLCRPRSSQGPGAGGRRGTRKSAVHQGLPAVQGRKSSLQSPKVTGEMGAGDPAFRAGLRSAPAGSFSLEGLGHEDISPSIFMLQELKHAASLPSLTQGEEEGEAEAAPSPELSSWMSATLASLPCKRKDALPPLKDRRPLEMVRPAPIVKVHKESTVDPPPSQQASPAKKQERRAPQSQGELPSAAEVLERLTSGEEGFSWTQMSRMASTFKRFTVVNTKEIKVEDLRTVMQHLGYMMTDEATIKDVALKVTPNPIMTYHEFVSFNEKLTQHEHHKFKQIFNTFDEDGNGRLSVSELRKFMVAIGFTPLRAMMREAMRLVNADGADSLGFDEMLHFLAIYRHAEGFTNGELKDLQSLFARAKVDDSNEVPANRITTLLRGFYGPQSSGTAKRIGEQVAGDAELEEDEQTSILGLKLPETLIWARRVREAEIQAYREKFKVYDKDGSNSIDMKELQGVIADLGYTLTASTIQEAMKEAEDEYSGKQEGHLDFDEFVNIVLTVRSRDGFSKAEIHELQDAFERFHASSCQEVETQSLCEILRYMGHNAWVDEVQGLLPAAGIDPAGAIDFRHFQWFMRLHREKELGDVRRIFQRYEEKGLHGVPVQSFRAALGDLGYPSSCQPQGLEKLAGSAEAEKLASISEAQEEPPEESPALQPEALAGAVAYDALVDMVDACRAFRVAQQRRCAGFSEGELEHFRGLYVQFDADSKGSLSLLETSALLEELGFKMKTPFDRERFLTSIDKARANARCVGVENVGDADSPLEYWTLVQLIRVLMSSDKSVMDREAKAIAQTKFGQSEVDGFKEIFTSCCAVQAREEEQLAAASFGGEEGAATKELSKEAVQGVLRSLGMTLDAESRQRLDGKIDELNGLSRVDFADFLRLMRWMLETNFADIEGSVAQVVTKQLEESERQTPA